MFARRHETLTHIAIHLVAAVFTFSAIASALLGYDVYQNQTSNNKVTIGQKVTKPIRAAYTAYITWTQTNWDGTSPSTFTPSWGGSGGWTKHSDLIGQSGYTYIGSGIRLANAAVVFSSVFDLGSKRISSVSLDEPSGMVDTYVRGASTPGAVPSASWVGPGFDCVNANNRYVQYRMVNNSGGSVDVNSASLTTLPWFIYGTVKDASTDSGISGATVNYGSGSTTTAFLLKNNSLVKSAQAGEVKGSGTGSYGFAVGYYPSTTVNVTVSKSGYNSQTKTVTLPTNPCSGSSTLLDFSLTKTSSSSSSSSPSSGSSVTETETSNVVPTTTTDSIVKVKLPATFTQKGSKTTDLSKIKDPKKVTGLVLDVVGIGTIKFNEAVDLSANKTIAAFEKLNKYLVVKAGYVELNSKILSALNKKATITMFKLKHLSTPEIFVNGKKDSSGVVSNISYDPKSGKLGFDVAHFTKFEAAAKFEIVSPASTQVTDPNTLVKVKVSDPETTVTGSFNGVELAKVTPDKKTGEFTLEKLVFEKGENVLKLSGESKLGKVAPLTVTFTYGQEEVIDSSNKNQLYTALVIVLLSALVSASILGYLLYRRKKLRSKPGGKEKKEPTETFNKD